MYTYRILPLFVLVLFLISACGPEEPAVTSLKIPMDRFERDEIIVFNIEEEIREVFTADNDSIIFTIDKPTFLNVAVGRAMNYIYLQPGEQLSLDTISTDPLVLTPNGEHSAENAYLLRLAQAVEEDAHRMTLREMGRSEPDSFLIKLEQKYSASNTLLQELQADANISADLKAAVGNYLAALKGTHLMNYKYVYNGSQDSLPPLPDNFYSVVDKENLTNNTWLWFSDSRELISSWHSKDFDYSEFESPTEYFAALLTSAQEAYPGTLVGDFAEYNMLTDYINFGNGIDNAGTEIAVFQERINNTYLLERLTATIEPWLALRAGEPAPDFLVEDRNGEEVRLADLAGQRVYIDVWATWCGPCIREIPALKELEKDLHDSGVQFVSISIDAEKDHEKWLNFIQERELGGLQLMADGAWQSDVVKAYNINGIPRFLLIDEAGKIISADAPRPSDPAVRDMLLGEG